MTAAELPPEADADFEPTMTNTVLFLLSSSMLVTTFATNYTGRPYMASLSSNKVRCRNAFRHTRDQIRSPA